MFSDVTALEGWHVTGKYKDTRMHHTCSRPSAWDPHSKRMWRKGGWVRLALSVCQKGGESEDERKREGGSDGDRGRTNVCERGKTLGEEELPRERGRESVCGLGTRWSHWLDIGAIGLED